MKTIEREITTILKVSEDKEHTYSITKITAGEMKKHMILILLYPTRTEDNILSDDDTMNNIMSHLTEMGFDSVTILNLFSKVVKGCRMSTRGINVDRENLDYIKEQFIKNEAFKNSTWVIAWGQTAGRSKVVCEAKKELLEEWKKKYPKKKLYQLSVSGIEKTIGMAPHPLYLGIRKKMSKWVLAEIDYNELLQIVNGEKETKSQEIEKHK